MNPHLLSYSEDSRVLAILDQATKPNNSFGVTLFDHSLDMVVMAQVFQKLPCRHLLIASDLDQAREWFHDLKIIDPSISYQMLEPSIEIKKNSVNIYKGKQSNRQIATEALLKTTHALTITYPEALVEAIPNTSRQIKVYKTGETFGLRQFIDLAEKMKFERVPYVYEYGQFSIRGNIVDVFSYSHTQPVRIELFDDEIIEIRAFEVEDQLSTTILNQLILSGPISEVKDVDYRSLWQLLPTDTQIWIADPHLMQKKIQDTLEHIDAYLDQEAQNNLSPNYWIDPNSIVEIMDKWPYRAIGKPNEKLAIQWLTLEEQPRATPIHKNFNKLYQELNRYHAEGYFVALMCDDQAQFDRYRAIFSDLGDMPRYTEMKGEWTRGFEDKVQKKIFFTSHEIFERNQRIDQSNKNSQSAQAILLKNLKELKPGDYVTHIDHGVGRFSGLEKLEVNGNIQEAVRLIYQNNDILYVHINSLHKISKYVGKDGVEPKLNKIGSDSWQAIKRKTKKQIKDIAEDLIKLYAKRKASKGYAYSADTYLQYELEESFEYQDTPDQAQATRDVKADMEREIPMDRLVCGDVGFGKTEIAIRAAFKAVADSKQVAVLVPTTILALQHYRTFSNRLKDFPCNVEFINRFKTTKQKKEIYQKLEEGKIDILIGTHAIVSAKVKFKDLGLLIIDEEQKFGVAVKEKLKQLKLNVDTLTLTATPIPRTLQFSLLGARDYSLIQTPPPNRIPVYTEICQFDPQLIKEIIENEVFRGGQVFFVNNRINELEQLRNTMAQIMPNISFALAHGQMPGEQLEDIIIDFMERKYDVLFSTNIIESGIDMPNVNTIIIHNAHQFGMSDLHQMRGRVGRSNRKAYCYLICPNIHALTSDAKQRLTAIERHSELGSGFQIAMRDLDLRGAGNLLGGEQSGFIADIGYDTYMKILDETITELKENDYSHLYETHKPITKYTKDCAIETDQNLFIPDSYVPQSQERMSLYTEINNLETEEKLQEFINNLKDRFGPPPEPIYELAEAIRLKWTATALGIERIIIKNGVMKCYLIQNQESKFYQSDTFGKMLNYIGQNPVGKSMKQTSQNLIIEYRNVYNCQEARIQLMRILENV